MKRYKTISIYSGTGLMDCGFLNEGFDILWGCELLPEYTRAYNFAISNHFATLLNFRGNDEKIVYPELEPRDITQVSREEILSSTKDNQIDGIIGGPPCQDFSIGGKNAGEQGDRGKLVHDYLKKVNELKPSFFVFENVEGLYKTKKHRVTFDALVKEFESLNYQVWHTILNPIHYGVPQDRQRVFIVAFRKEIIDKLSRFDYIIPDNHFLASEGYEDRDALAFRWPKKKYENPKKIYNWPTTWDFQGHVRRDEIVELPRELCVISAFDDIKLDTHNQNEYFMPKSGKFYEVQEGDTSKKSFKRLHRFRYSPAVAYGNNEVHLHPTEPRRLTVREALKLQSAPNTFILPEDMTLTDKFKMISNGVPTRLAELLAIEVKRTLTMYEKL